MKFRGALQILVTLSLLAITLLPKLAQACSVCLGNPHSEQVQGMKYALLLLLVVTAGTLASLAAFFIYLNRRARACGAQMSSFPGAPGPNDEDLLS